MSRSLRITRLQMKRRGWEARVAGCWHVMHRAAGLQAAVCKYSGSWGSLVVATSHCRLPPILSRPTSPYLPLPPPISPLSRPGGDRRGPGRRAASLRFRRRHRAPRMRLLPGGGRGEHIHIYMYEGSAVRPLMATHAPFSCPASHPSLPSRPRARPRICSPTPTQLHTPPHPPTPLHTPPPVRADVASLGYRAPGVRTPNAAPAPPRSMRS